jgi:peptidyl-prolyl cis-trans isomerase SurA
MDVFVKFDPVLVQLINTLKPFQISQPSIFENRMEAKEGVRIVRVVRTVAPHRANLDEDYQLIQNAALNQKKEQALKEWANEKMANAYIRLDDAYRFCDFLYNWPLAKF